MTVTFSLRAPGVRSRGLGMSDVAWSLRPADSARRMRFAA